MKFKEGELFCIYWKDHCGHNDGRSWHNLDRAKEDLEPIIIKTVGWILNDSKEHIAVAASIDRENDCCCGTMCIMKNCIVQCERIALGGAKEV